MEIGDFEPLYENCDLPEIDFMDLSSDQAYLYEIVSSIKSGICLPRIIQ